ncbi:MAG: bifunctional oligoribonuclease/PAP phosphatase NrnA [Candidatus Omnitrophica bacterium]|nr:bifunctional oligoribonuclease/PAP phosphatase NrnA [Candidatus Omnitrophota bacterium]MDD5352804.1 bifunctional oligoribonuclease/PAP phosphatase NrnA [Candidatus Omnitrophota bacterium]MDD5550403.1 bifunctional oligoribonuclease/PAP phosphatase NrnA [Candidatus Omnitrophota bacterium]
MKISRLEKNKIKDFLRKHRNFLISAHTSPEGDSLGAQLAFARAIRAIGKNCDIVNSDRHLREYAFLPGVKDIRTRPRIKKYDAAIILDCSDISRIGNVVNLLDKNIPILNIDHHISNTYFGDINLVDAKVSSACEMLFLMFKELNIKLDRFMAICLYAGIVTDTGSFRYTNTRASTHFVVSQLLKWRISAPMIFRNIYENLNFSDLKLINSALSNLRKDATGRIAWVNITRNLINKYKPQIDLTDNILNSIRSLKGTEVCILFREKSGTEKNIRVNLRSRGKVDVNEIAQHFGGGGHATASGVTLRNISLDEAEKRIINFIRKKLSKIK